MANTNKLFTANILDNVSDEFGYTVTMSARQKKDIDPAHAIVYQNVPKGKRFLHELSDHIPQLLRVFYLTPIDKEITCDIIVEFPCSKPAKVLKQIRRLKGEFTHEPCSYPEYIQQWRESYPIKLTNRFEILLSEMDDDTPLEAVTSLNFEEPNSEEPNFDEESIESDTESDDWVSVVRRKPGMLTRMKKRRQEQCRWGDHCAKASNCPNKHTSSFPLRGQNRTK